MMLLHEFSQHAIGLATGLAMLAFACRALLRTEPKVFNILLFIVCVMGGGMVLALSLMTLMRHLLN